MLVTIILQISSVLPLAKNFQSESFLVVHGTGDGEWYSLFEKRVVNVV